MYTVGNKVIWPTSGVIFHILIVHPRIQSVLMICRNLSKDVRASVWCLLHPCAVVDSHDVSVMEEKKNKQMRFHLSFFPLLSFA